MKKIFEATGPFVFKAQKLVDRVSKIAKDKFNLENKIKEEGTDTTVYMIKCTYKNDGIKSFIENVIKKDGESTNADKLLEAWKAAINDQIFKKADKDNLAYIKYFDGGFGLCYVNKGLAQDIANNLNDNTIISISEVSATSVNSNNIERFKSSGVSSLDVAKMDQAVLKIAEDNYAKYIKGLEDAKAKADAEAEKLRKEGTETEVYAVKWKFNKDQLIKQVKKCAEELKSSGDLKASEVIKKWTDEYYNKIMQIAVDNNLICIRNNKDLAVDLCFDTTSEAEPFFNKVKGINTCGSFDDIKKIKVNSSLIADFNKSAEFEANESVATIIKQVADESQDKFMQELAQAEEDALAKKAEEEASHRKGDVVNLYFTVATTRIKEKIKNETIKDYNAKLTDIASMIKADKFKQLFVDSFNVFNIKLPYISLNEADEPAPAAKKTTVAAKKTTPSAEAKPAAKKEPSETDWINLIVHQIRGIFDVAVKKHAARFKDEFDGSVECSNMDEDSNKLVIQVQGATPEYLEKLKKGINELMGIPEIKELVSVRNVGSSTSMHIHT